MDAVATLTTGSVPSLETATTLAMAGGTDADPDKVSLDGPGATTGETTTTGEGIAGAITGGETIVRGTAAPGIIAPETPTGGTGGMTIDGETFVSATTIGAIALFVEFNIGIAGDKLVPFTGRESSEDLEGVKQLMVS